MFDRVANGFDAPIHVLGHSTSNFGGAAAGFGQATGTIDDFVFVGLRQLAEALSATDFFSVGFYEIINAGVEESHAFSATVKNELATDQALLAPAGDCLAGDVEHLCEIFDRMDRLTKFLDTNVCRCGQVFDESMKIVTQIFAVDFHNRCVFGSVAGDAETHKLKIVSSI